MKVNRQDLLEALGKVKPGLASVEYIEQSTSFAFVGDRVVTYNDEISISHPVKELDIDGAVSAEGIYKFLSKVRKDRIEIEVTDTEVHLSAGRAKAGVALQAEVRLPLVSMRAKGGKRVKWYRLPDKFLPALHFTLPSCSKDMSKPILNCVHIKGGTVEACDNYRATTYRLGKEMRVRPLLIPQGSIKELLAYPIRSVATTKGWAHFRTGDGTRFSCRTFEGNYPDLSPLFNMKGVKVALPKAMKAILQRASVFAGPEVITRAHMDEKVKISFAENKITIRAKGAVGWFKETAKIKYSGKPIDFTINPFLLESICEERRTAILGATKLKFRGKHWDHLVALWHDDEAS